MPLLYFPYNLAHGPNNKVRVIATFLLTTLASNAALAFRLDAGIGVRGGYTDNVNLTKNKQSDVPVEVFTDFRYFEQSASIDSLVDGSLAYRDYLKNNASDEVRPNIHGNLLWRIDPDRWSWTADGAWRQVRKNQLDSDAPDNLENQFVIWTGPDFQIPLSSVTKFIAEARIGYLTKSNTKDDNYNYGGALRLDYELSETSSLSANLEGKSTRYTENDTEGNIDLRDSDIADLFMEYARQDARFQTQINLGISYANIKDADNESDLFLRVNAFRELNALNRAGLRIFFGYDTESSTAIIRTPLPGVEQPTEASVQNVFYDQRGEIYYERSGKRSSFQGTLYARRRDYVDNSSQDENLYGTGLKWARQLTRLSRAELFGGAYVKDFKDMSIKDKDYILGARINQRFSRKILGAAEIRYRQRTSDVSEREYEETAFFVTLGYQWSY